MTSYFQACDDGVISRGKVLLYGECNAASGWRISSSVCQFWSICTCWDTLCVNFQGLEDQLLSVIVKYERAELEQRRETLIQETRSDRLTTALTLGHFIFP